MSKDSGFLADFRYSPEPITRLALPWAQLTTRYILDLDGTVTREHSLGLQGNDAGTRQSQFRFDPASPRNFERTDAKPAITKPINDHFVTLIRQFETLAALVVGSLRADISLAVADYPDSLALYLFAYLDLSSPPALTAPITLVRLLNGDPLSGGLLRGWLMGGTDDKPIIDGPGDLVGAQYLWRSATTRLYELYNGAVSDFVRQSQEGLSELQDSFA